MNILIVDDNAVNILLVKHLVMKLDDCTPICFTSSHEGLAWCSEGKPDVLLIDYMMPDIDGLEFIQVFRELPHCADVPIVMITAAETDEVRYSALEMGANDFLNKPVDKVEFTARMNNMLKLRKSQLKLADRARWLEEEVQKATRDLRKQEQEMLLLIAKVAEYRDPEVRSNIIRLSSYARIIARNLKLDASEQEMISQAALMFDIGKISIPDNLFKNPDILTKKEFEIMKGHTKCGHEILQYGSSKVFKVAAEMAISHHERYNGTGYPNALQGDDIPLYGRIIAVADSFDELTSEFSYKEAWSVEKAAEFLAHEKGGDFDPQCVDALLMSMDEVLEVMEKYQ